MADALKNTELPECPTEGGATAEEQDISLKPETTPTSSPTGEEPIGGRSPSMPPPPGLLSMPCLLKELRRDSSPDHPQAASPNTKSRPQEDSDSSPCLRSPSSSGHLGDSDTLSSAEETAVAPAQTAGRKSRRSHSESDTSSVAMAAKKNRCQERQVNGRVRVRGQRSQRQKERMRMLRQKREAAARRKPDLLQDSSTSDSDITAQSSSSSSSASSDNEGGTISSHAPASRHRSETSGSHQRGRGFSDSGVTNTTLGGVLEEALTRFAAMQRQTEERFRVWMDRLARLHSDDDDQSSSELREGRSQVSSFLPSSESQETLAAYQLARLNANPAPPSPTTALNGNLETTDPNLLNV